MVKEKPTTPPPPHLPAEGNRPPETSLTETVLLSPPSSTTDRRNLRLIRIEFTTKRRGKDSNDTTNNEPLQALLKKGTLPLFEADPNLKLHPITDWPANFTTASSSVKPAPNTEQHITNNTEKTTENKKNHPSSPRPTPSPSIVLVSTNMSSIPPTSTTQEKQRKSSSASASPPARR
jgi:hypothetical protein